VNWRILPWTVSTYTDSDHKMSLTTTSATPVMSKNRGGGKRRMTDWLSKVLRTHMTNSVDGRHHLCVLILSRQSQMMSAFTTSAPQKCIKGPWGRVEKTQMVKGKTTPSPRLYKQTSNEAMFVMFPVSWPGRRVFQNTNLSTKSRKWPRHHKLTCRSWKDSWEGSF
jgi:hypothetical protein